MSGPISKSLVANAAKYFAKKSRREIVRLTGVSGQLKPASDGQLKTGHLK
jgi:hypothetical protein